METKITHLTNENFDAEIAALDFAVVDFWAAWCGPCKMFAPVFESVAAELTDITFGKLEVDEGADIAERFNIVSIPTLVIFKKGEVAAKTVGYKNAEQLKAFILENKN